MKVKHYFWRRYNFFLQYNSDATTLEICTQRGQEETHQDHCQDFAIALQNDGNLRNFYEISGSGFQHLE